jgi:hypothetical protein
MKKSEPHKKFWPSVMASVGKPGIVAFILGSVALGIVTQWFWIERNCGLDNLFANAVTKCADNKLRLLLGGPMVVALNLSILWLAYRIILSKSLAMKENILKGLILTLSAPGMLALVIFTGNNGKAVLIVFLVLAEVWIYFRYLHPPARALMDTLLGYFEAGVALDVKNNTLIVRVLRKLNRDECITAIRRIAKTFASQNFTAVTVLVDQEYPGANRLLELLATLTKNRSVRYSINSPEGSQISDNLFKYPQKKSTKKAKKP